MTRDTIALELGVDRTYVDKLCRGQHRPGLEVALRLEKLTEGKSLLRTGLAPVFIVKGSSDAELTSRGKEFDGNRWNDLHYSRPAQLAARERAKRGKS
jgi:hypothetical protein